MGGDWDQDTINLTKDNLLYESLVDRFEHGLTWEETQFYQEQLERLNRGECTYGGSSTPEGLRSRYEEIDDIYKSMRRHGYISNQELIQNPSKEALNEVEVYIARDGEILFGNEGTHRIRLAKLLDLDSVAVRIIVRHTLWQEKRSRLINEDVSPTDLGIDADHPDLVEETTTFRRIFK